MEADAREPEIKPESEPEPEPVQESEVFVTVSDALEYLFCPRFIFFERCLMIAEHQEKRYKVLKGRELHEGREKVNRDYIRKRLNCTRKEISVYLTSHKHHFKGEVDEILFLDDGTAAPLDREQLPRKQGLKHQIPDEVKRATALIESYFHENKD